MKDKISECTYSNKEVLLITRLNGPPKGHDGLAIFFIHREESVALLLVHQGLKISQCMSILMDKKCTTFTQQKDIMLCLLSDTYFACNTYENEKKTFTC